MKVMCRLECTDCLVHKVIAAATFVEAKTVAEASGWDVGVLVDRCSRCKAKRDAAVPR